jgi:hypothetical protein
MMLVLLFLVNLKLDLPLSLLNVTIMMLVPMISAIHGMDVCSLQSAVMTTMNVPMTHVILQLDVIILMLILLTATFVPMTTVMPPMVNTTFLLYVKIGTPALKNIVMLP